MYFFQQISSYKRFISFAIVLSFAYAGIYFYIDMFAR